jgi:hypothetical protein
MLFRWVKYETRFLYSLAVQTVRKTKQFLAMTEEVQSSPERKCSSTILPGILGIPGAQGPKDIPGRTYVTH